MYRTQRPQRTSLKINQGYIGETLEQKIDRIVNNGEPIKDGAPTIYTERKDGVHPEMDIRTDKWDLAAEVTDYGSKSHIAKRQAAVIDMKKKKDDGKPESTGATE